MPLLATAMARLDGAANATGWLRRPLRPEEFVRIARQRTGLHDCGDADFGAPLARLRDAGADQASHRPR
jgi:hypothetical protein